MQICQPYIVTALLMHQKGTRVSISMKPIGCVAALSTGCGLLLQRLGCNAVVQHTSQNFRTLSILGTASAV